MAILMFGFSSHMLHASLQDADLSRCLFVSGSWTAWHNNFKELHPCSESWHFTQWYLW